MTRTSKPRKFRSLLVQARGECTTDCLGNKVVDASLDIFDDKTSAKRIREYAKWLTRAAKWLEAKECEQ